MKPIFIVFMLFLFVSNLFGNDTDKLYPIVKNELYGYIDDTGRIVIEPHFFAVGQFSEGLAPVRLNGTYGYIDTNGIFVIPSKYDLASSFQAGIAKVFIDGKPYFIDRKGNILFNHNYSQIFEFGNNTFAIAITGSGKYGVIDKLGKLQVDTVYAKINSFTNGVAIVTGFNYKPNTDFSLLKNNCEIGVIDSVGNRLVHYGTYKRITEFKNGYALVELIVEWQKDYHDYQGIIDQKGNYKFTIPSKKWGFSKNDDIFFQNFAVVNIYASNPEKIKAGKGVINPNGEIIFSNTEWGELTPFTFNRAFAKVRDGKWFLIDTKGKAVNLQSFNNILFDKYSGNTDDLFQNGIAFVKTDKGWGAIDTLGNFIIEPTDLKNINENNMFRRGNILFFEEYIAETNIKNPYIYGFWNTKNNVIVKPTYHYIDLNGFDGKLIHVMQDGQMNYINQAGNLVYQEKETANSKKLNIDYMNRGYFYAASKYKKELEGLGGWGKSKNSSINIIDSSIFSKNTFQIVIDTNHKAKWADIYDGIKLYVANTSKETLYFDAQDSRLYLNIQAKNRFGEWKDIEYLPSSWCGNSYHSLSLEPNELWEFTTPIYHGEFKTKLRAKLMYKMNLQVEDSLIKYSNEIDGYINPGQFWNKRVYYPRGIMDSYDD